MTDPVPVLIVDDQAPFRRAARAVVTATPGFEVVGEAESGEVAVTMAAALAPGLVLMDINLPGINGIEATRQITAARPGTIVLLLSTYQDADLPADAGDCASQRENARVVGNRCQQCECFFARAAERVRGARQRLVIGLRAEAGAGREACPGPLLRGE